MLATGGKNLTDSDWALLEVVDPDQIVSFAELDEDLRTKLKQRLTLLEVRHPDQLAEGEANHSP